MKQLIHITPEQLERVARGESVEIVPARVSHQIALDADDDGLLTAEYVEAHSKGRKHRTEACAIVSQSFG